MTGKQRTVSRILTLPEWIILASVTFPLSAASDLAQGPAFVRLYDNNGGSLHCRANQNPWVCKDKGWLLLI
jgi:hypothetical protein